jgi:hypothetical protein
MAHAESLQGHIARQRDALEGLQGQLLVEREVDDGDSWDARKTLLHLLGSVEAARGNIADTSGSWRAVQAGGEYVDRPDIETATEACTALLGELEALGEDVRLLDDRALAQPITVLDGDRGEVGGVPVGLAVRHLLTEHFDEHMAQLREALHG